MYSRNWSNKPASSSIIEFASELSAAGRGSGFGGDTFACNTGDGVGLNGLRTGFDTVGLVVADSSAVLGSCRFTLLLVGVASTLPAGSSSGRDVRFKVPSEGLFLEKEVNDGVIMVVVVEDMDWLVCAVGGKKVENGLEFIVAGFSDEFANEGDDENGVEGGGAGVVEAAIGN